MTKNSILKSIKKSLNFNDNVMLKVYQLVNYKVTIEDVKDVLREEGDPKFILLNDEALKLFLDGLIVYERGSINKKHSQDKDVILTNNMILKKLRIAFDLKDDDMVRVFSLADINISKSELTPYFRKEGHKNYKQFSESHLKSFIKGYKVFLTVE